jgi:pSer/pThr/pTyr-binding forkhead associated (FHA) protein
MFSVIITDQSGERSVKALDKPDVSIGRDRTNDIVLARGNVSKVHARILHNRGAFVVVDNKSTNGTFVNGERVESPHVLRATDKIFVGDFVLEVSPDEPAGDKAAAPVAKPPRAASQPDLAGPTGADVPRKRRAPKSPVAVNWDEDWNESDHSNEAQGGDFAPGDGGAVDEAGVELGGNVANDADLDFDAPVEGATTDRQTADELSMRSAAGSGAKSRSRSLLSATYSPSEVIADCLREYVDLDAHYRLKAMGSDCGCGECLLCRARQALEGFDAEHQ